jgi:TPR repeat protein
MLRKKRLLVLIGLGLCLGLACGIQSVSAADERAMADMRQNTSASAEPEPWASTTVFEESGLLAHPGETAPEILMRAHKREPDAMFLAASGYGSGICGFPKNIFLANEWVQELAALGNTEAAAHVSIQVWLAGPRHLDSLGGILADCVLARESVYMDILRKTGADLDEHCEKVAEFKPTIPGWEEEYSGRLKEWRSLKAQGQAVARLMRELRFRPATPREQEELAVFVREFFSDTLLFLAATTHNPDKEPPDWSAERLMAFLEEQRIGLEKARQDGNKDFRPGFAGLIHEAGEVVVRQMTNAFGDTAELIRKAHSEDIPSVYALAERYANGTAGFIKSERLSELWLMHAALLGDKKAAWALAAKFFAVGRLIQAWAWASIVSEYDDIDETLKTAAQSLTANIETIQGEKQAHDRENVKKSFTDVRAVMVKWRLSGEKK